MFLQKERYRIISEQHLNASKNYNQMNLERVKYQQELNAKCVECETIRKDFSALVNSHKQLENSLTETMEVGSYFFFVFEFRIELFSFFFNVCFYFSAIRNQNQGKR